MEGKKRKAGAIGANVPAKKKKKRPLVGEDVPETSTSSTSMVAAVPGTVGKAKLKGWDFFRSLGSPRYILSPMVGQSELAFRILCRRHGVQLAYTPMFISSLFVEVPSRAQLHCVYSASK